MFRTADASPFTRAAPLRRRWALRAAVALAFAAVLIPFVLVAIPPLTDYPNHLARFWLIAGGLDHAPMNRFYVLDWRGVSTNIGVDLMVRVFAGVADGLALGEVAAVLAAVLPPLGALALSLRLRPRLNAWHALIPIAAWSTTFLMGFLNFQIGIGLALLFAAIDPVAGRRRPWFWAALRVPFGLVLAATHMYGLFFYAVLLAGLEFGPAGALPPVWPDLRGRLLRAAGAAAWCLAPLALVVALARDLPGSQTGFGVIQYDTVAGMLITPFSPVVTYSLPVELAAALVLIGFVVWLWRRRALDVHGGLMLAAIGLMVLSVIVPNYAAGTGWVARRIPIMAFLAALAAIQVRADVPARRAAAAMAMALGLALFRTAWIGWTWLSLAPDMAATERAMARIPAGAAVLPAQHQPTALGRWRSPVGRYVFGLDDPTFRHFAALATPLRGAFIPNLFAALGKQPLRVRGAWAAVTEPDGGHLASVGALMGVRGPRDPRYLAGWRDRFDYILVLNADQPDAYGAFRPPPGVTLADDEGFAQLWRIQHGPPP